MTAEVLLPARLLAPEPGWTTGPTSSSWAPASPASPWRSPREQRGQRPARHQGAAGGRLDPLGAGRHRRGARRRRTPPRSTCTTRSSPASASATRTAVRVLVTEGPARGAAADRGAAPASTTTPTARCRSPARAATTATASRTPAATPPAPRSSGRWSPAACARPGDRGHRARARARPAAATPTARCAGVTLHVMGEGQRDGVGAVHGAGGGAGDRRPRPGLRADHQPARCPPATAWRWRCAPAPTVARPGVRAVPPDRALARRRGSRGQQPLVSEAVRGEGAFLVDDDGDAVHARASTSSPTSPRATSWPRRSCAGCARPAPTHVWLDARAPRRARCGERRFPTILRVCRAHGIDPVHRARSRSRPPRTTPAAACAPTSTAVRQRARPVRLRRGARAPGCTARTGWPPTRCSRAWSSPSGSAPTSRAARRHGGATRGRPRRPVRLLDARRPRRRSQRR